MASFLSHPCIGFGCLLNNFTSQEHKKNFYLYKRNDNCSLLIDWLIDWSINRSIDWLTDWLIMCWLIDVPCRTRGDRDSVAIVDRSESAVTLDEWHTVHASRAERLGQLSVDAETASTEGISPGRLTQLTLKNRPTFFVRGKQLEKRFPLHRSQPDFPRLHSACKYSYHVGWDVQLYSTPLWTLSYTVLLFLLHVFNITQ